MALCAKLIVLLPEDARVIGRMRLVAIHALASEHRRVDYLARELGEPVAFITQVWYGIHKEIFLP